MPLVAILMGSESDLEVMKQAVPRSRSPLKGTDALHAIVQMPAGIPVATVAIDGARNAAYLALEILALQDDALAQRLGAGREAERRRLEERNRALGFVP